MFASFYVPHRFVHHFQISGIFLVSGIYSAWTVHKVNPPYFMSRTPIKICENWKTTNNQNSVSVPAQLYTHMVKVYCERWRRFIIVGTWSQWDIKLPMYQWFWKFGRLFFVFGQITLGRFSGYFEWASTFLPPKFRGKKVLAPSKYPLN